MANQRVKYQNMPAMPGISDAVVQTHDVSRYAKTVSFAGKDYQSFEARQNDLAIPGDKPGDRQYRTEARINVPEDDVDSDEVAYWGMTHLLPSDFPDLVDGGKPIKVTLAQWHNGTWDPVATLFKGGKFYTWINAHGPDDGFHEIPGAVRGTPFHLDYEFRWKSGNDAGSLTVRKDGAIFLDLPNVTLIVDKRERIYAKFGTYLNSTASLDKAGYPPLKSYVADVYAGAANRPVVLPPKVGTPAVPVPEDDASQYAILADIRAKMAALQGPLEDKYGSDAKYAGKVVEYVDILVTKLRKRDAS